VLAFRPQGYIAARFRRYVLYLISVFSCGVLVNIEATRPRCGT